MNQIKVSVVIPARDEEKWIRGCLDSILSNDFPHTRLEILVVDGMSEDRTRDIVHEFVRRHPCVRLIQNPRRIIPAALNLGIREARGEIIVRMDAHTTYATDYIRLAVQALETSGAAMVGAMQPPVGDSLVTCAIASATSSPFGVGNSYYHYGKESRWVEDSVYLGVWYKKTLKEIGDFNEKWLVNEDSELNHRLRAAGGKILLSAELHCSYHVRGSLRALGRQYFRYGMWRAKTSLIHPASLSWRQLVPPIFEVSLLLSLALAWISLPLALIIPCAYMIANLAITGATVARKGWRHCLVPIAFCTLHISWGSGFLVGLVRFCMTRRRGESDPLRVASPANTQVL
jgi:succinoglycan biosynthesis protein ExoA